ncbi:MAG TPA: acyl carrier protein, partial [Candidatus Blautia merdipullorum]|nr:acyl carrier protein [Candidatus Blautia merdipullorum]
LTEDTGLYEDMGLASVEAYVLLCDLEDTFGIKIPASELRKVGTAGDLCRLVIQLLK